MTVSPLYIRHQAPVIAALLKTAAGPALKKVSFLSQEASPFVRARLAPRPENLVRDYIRHVGGDPAWYKGALPPHLFPQWGFPLMARTLAGLPYNLAQVLNGGASFTVHAPIPAHEPLVVTARLAGVEETESKVLIKQKLVTGVEAKPHCLECTVNAIIPKRGGGRGNKERPRIPESAREIARLDLAPDSGLDFAFLTGDFNPIHWLAVYARLSGFPSTILHGFSTMARTLEALNKNVLGQSPFRLRHFECRFVRPLVLPAQVFVFEEGSLLFTGMGPGTEPFLMGEFQLDEG